MDPVAEEYLFKVMPVKRAQIVHVSRSGNFCILWERISKTRGKVSKILEFACTQLKLGCLLEQHVMLIALQQLQKHLLVELHWALLPHVSRTARVTPNG
jgi:hypothetical protein